MTSFILICAVMLIAAVCAVAMPLVRAVPVAAKGEPPAPRATSALVVIALSLPILAFALYHAISNFPWQDPLALAGGSAAHGAGSNAGTLEQAAAQLEARLAANPQDAEGWRMLGRTYLMTGHADKAVAAYEKADSILGGNDASLKLDIAEAMVLTENPAVQGQAKEIIDAALQADPNNGKALWYSGVMAMRGGDAETAKARFQKLLELNPPEEIRQIVTEQLANLGVQVPAAPAGAGPVTADTAGGTAASGAEAPAPTGRTIRVAVSVDPSVAAKLKPGMPLFVAAREPGIPGPPLAAVRLTSDQLPTTVVLSDANSMIQGRNLSSVDNVEIVAHVALSGTPVVSSGDLVGTVQNGKKGSSDVAVVINRVAP